MCYIRLFLFHCLCILPGTLKMRIVDIKWLWIWEYEIFYPRQGRKLNKIILDICVKVHPPSYKVCKSSQVWGIKNDEQNFVSEHPITMEQDVSSLETWTFESRSLGDPRTDNLSNCWQFPKTLPQDISQADFVCSRWSMRRWMIFSGPDAVSGTHISTWMMWSPKPRVGEKSATYQQFKSV